MKSYDLVFLADNEWGNSLMREVAQEWFAAHPACHFVQVYEHAGWSLTYHRADLEVVHSANDLAVFRADVPRPTHYSGRSHRRPVLRPDIREVSTLAQYAPLLPALESCTAPILSMP